MVEDSPFDFELFRDFLEEVETIDFEIVRCETLAETGHVLQERRDFVAILLDLTLPDSDGLATFNHVISTAPEIPIVVLTGMESRSLSVQALEKGAANYLIKQRVTPDRIAAAIMAAASTRASTNVSNQAT